MLRTQNEQRWYSLSFERGAVPAIKVGIYVPLLESMINLSRTRRDVQHYQDQWKFESYQPDMRVGFGFENTFAALGVEGGYHWLSAGFSKGMKEINATAVSLGMLLHGLEFLQSVKEPSFSADPNRLQLMTLTSAVVSQENYHSAPLGGCVSPALVNWVEKQFETRDTFLEIEEAMWLIWRQIARYAEKDRSKRHRNPYIGFRTRLDRNGSFFFDAPGNACGVFTEEWWNRQPGEGHELSCHNLDTPMQQLALIAGLANLHDLASADLDP